MTEGTEGRIIPQITTRPIDKVSIREIIKFALRKVDPHNPDQTERLIEDLYADVIKYGTTAIQRYEDVKAKKATEIAAKNDWHQSSDPMVWAIKFSEKLTSAPADGSGIDADDVGTIVGWFANAMSIAEGAGYQNGHLNATARCEAQLKAQGNNIIDQRQEINILYRTLTWLTKGRLHSHNPLASLVAGDKIDPLQKRVMTPPRDAGYGLPYDPTKGEDPQRPNVKVGPGRDSSGGVYIHRLATNENGEITELDVTSNGERRTIIQDTHND